MKTSDEHSVLALITGALTAPAAWITTETKLALLNHEGFSRTVIQVDSGRPDYLGR
jgi:hypothetical protein